MFRIFEPSAVFGWRLNWFSRRLTLLLLFPGFWVARSIHDLLIKKILRVLDIEFRAIFGQLAFPGATLISVSLFLLVLLNNFCGLFPYIFTSSSHLTFTLALALPLWLGHMLWAFSFNLESCLAHFVPLRTPVALIPLIVVIEFIRRVIRPLTLAVRLAANIIAGHLLLALLREKIVGELNIISRIILLALLLLTVLELGVRVIQSYVFSLLSTLYVNEVNSASFV